MRIAYNNLLDATVATITESSEDVNYPVENVQDQRLATSWRSATLTAQTVIIDLGTAQTVTTAAIIGHNITATASVLTVAGGTSASVFATAETLTHDAGMILKFFTGQSYRYWKFSVDNQGNADGYISIGRLWLGPYITVDPSSMLDFRVSKKRSDTVVYGKHRQKFADPGAGWRRFELDFPDTDSSVLSVIETMYDTVGNHSSMIFCNFDTDRTWDLVEPCYVSIDGSLEFVNRGGYKATWRMSLEEDR